MSAEGRISGRYAIYGEIAAGGMATVHFARLFGTAGFSRTVAIKRLHAQLAKDPEFVAMFLDEAHVASHIRHTNVVPTLDVVSMQGEIFIVMEYVHGESLWRLLAIEAESQSGRAVPPRIAAAIVANVLHGLHAAHEATNEAGEPLGIVHRDVSPQNILVGKDGVARVLDFGIVKARDRIHVTRGGLLKGKVSYMAPEQLAGRADRRTDIYAAGVVLWEALTGRKLFFADGDFATADKVREGKIDPPSTIVPGLPPALDAIVLRALAKSPDGRFPDASAMATAIERDVGIAPPSEVGAWVTSLARDVLDNRGRMLSGIEKSAVHFAPDTKPDAPMDADPDGVMPTRAIDVSPQGEATEVSLTSAVLRSPARNAPPRSVIVTGVVLATCASALTAFLLLHKGSAPHVTASAPPPPPPATSEAPPVSAAPAASSAPPVATIVLPPVVDVAPTHHAKPPDPCNPPYYLDHGIKRIKRGCLK